MLLQDIITGIIENFPNQDIDFELEKSDTPKQPSMLEGVTRYQLILNQQPTNLYLDKSEVEALERKHGRDKAVQLGIDSSTSRIKDLVKEQTNEPTNL